ncbi:MAG: PqqD family protein [Paludibacteraceae bacterium]|nr:PqqD family protein [Paludibacteraceae bacterium]MBQ8715007.1 PqqD family protein [Prevotella sp.]
MRIKKGFILREVCGEHVIMGEGLGAVNFGRLLALNETAAWLWKQADTMGDFTVEKLAEKLCEDYEVDNETAQNDVTAIVGQWQKEGVIE